MGMSYSVMPMKPEDLFRAEKERAVSARNSQHARLLAEAKAAFDKLMAEGQAARKSGRPRKHPLPPLKTSSSRTPAKPPAPVERPVVTATPALPKPAATPAAKAAKPDPPAARRHAAPPGKAAKAKGSSARKRTVRKSKPKAKRAKRR